MDTTPERQPRTGQRILLVWLLTRIDMKKLVLLHILVLLAARVTAFSTPQTNSHAWRIRSQTRTAPLFESFTASAERLKGVADFEAWFRQCEGSKCDGRIAHALFDGRLRGLAWKGESTSAMGQMASVPSSVVLQADESQPNWDAILACKLWEEVLQGSNGSLYGYISLLTQGHWDATSSKTEAPPSTAPNALRHWTQSQRQVLASSAVGQKLLDLDSRQLQDWHAKYSQLSVVDRPASLDQLIWAMEVVHSRAFRGVNQNAVSSLPALLAPVAAAAVGWAYYSSAAFPTDAVLYGLGIVAVLPSLYNAVAGQPSLVVLLPLIDSANHLESAGSSVDYNPLSRAFELSLQPNCIVPEGDGTQQLYISYGPKKDAELLLNYGFLPDVLGGEGSDETARQEQRRELAQTFLSRNA